MQILVILASAAGGAWLYSRFTKPAPSAAAPQLAGASTGAMELLAGHSYALQIMIDPSSVQWKAAGPPKDLASASQLIGGTFATLGWRVLVPPQLLDPASAARFLAGQPAVWILTAIWTRPERFQTQSPDWARMASAQELPALGA